MPGCASVEATVPAPELEQHVWYAGSDCGQELRLTLHSTHMHFAPTVQAHCIT